MSLSPVIQGLRHIAMPNNPVQGTVSQLRCLPAPDLRRYA